MGPTTDALQGISSMKDQIPPDPKQQILDAAIHLFARKGFSATGVREIARTANTNIAMISYYFGSKRGILEAVLDTFFQRYLEVTEQALDGDDPPEQKMRRFIRSMVMVLRNNNDLVRIAFTELPFDMPQIADFKAERIRRIAALFQQKLLPVLEERLPRPIRVEVVGPAFAGMLVSHFLLLPVIEGVLSTSFDEKFYEHYADDIADLLFYGVAGAKHESHDDEDNT
jgi:AcrR family transcriptional regulator